MALLSRLALVGALATAAAGPALAFDAKEKEEIGKIIREYLVTNPEVLYDAQQEWNRRQQAKLAEENAKVIETYVARIDEKNLHAVIGNPKGDVTLIEFFDYNCGYCRRAIKDIDALVDNDPNLRVVLMELPVIREESVGAAQVSIALNQTAPEKFRAFHDKLLGGQSLVTKDKALAVAAELGVDRKTLEAAMVASTVRETLLDSRQLADDLGIEATPTYVIGQAVIPNTQGIVDNLKGRIAALRKCGKAEC